MKTSTTATESSRNLEPKSNKGKQSLTVDPFLQAANYKQGKMLKTQVSDYCLAYQKTIKLKYKYYYM